jgi:FkbM family methyltransferase
MMRILKKWAVERVRPFLGNVVYVARRGLIKGMRRKGGFSFIPGSELSAEEEFLVRLRLSGSTVYDVGAWEGVYTLFFARAVGPAGKVITFEPNPANCERVLENLSLNNVGNVVLRPVALGRVPGRAMLVVEGGVAGEGHVRSTGDTDTRPKSSETIVQIDLATMDQEIEVHGLPPPDLVKIDVEGFELNVLQGMTATIAERRPRLFIEVHRVAERPHHSCDVVGFLLQRGYTVRHVEGGRCIDNATAVLAHSDHLYCE